MAEKIFQRRSGIFKIGIIIVIFFSTIIGFFNIAVLYWFGIPILGLIAGIILVWLANENIKTKILSTISVLPIIFLSFSVFYLLLPKAEPETFLISQNFRGQMEVVFDEPCGQPIIYEKGRRIYYIPDNGILITNAKQMTGVIDRKFYFVDETGNEIELQEFHWSKFEDEKNDWHWMYSNTKLSKDLVGAFWAYTNQFSFVISDYLSLENQDKETKKKVSKEFSEKVETILKQCRQTG